LTVKLLRKWLTKHPNYAEFRQSDDDVFYEALLKSASLRNDIVHGLLESINPDTGEFTMRRIKRVGTDLWSASTATHDANVPKYLASQATLATRHFVEIAKIVFEQDRDAA